MSLLEITGLSHSFGDTPLYQNAELSLNKGEHVGVVGQNGAGKSTLIKICTEQLAPDAGRVVWQPGISVGYLDQHAEIDRKTTMKSFLQSAFSSLFAMEREMIALYERAAGDPSCFTRASRFQEQLEAHDFYSVETRIEQVAGGLGLLTLGLDRPIFQMSGGQRAKVILAKLLLERPDVLLLDEPTNFLDKEHIDWLAGYLSSLENSYLVVSHDNGFLERISNRILDIDNEKIAKYYGTYSEYLRKKALLRQDYLRQYAAQQKEIRKTEEFIRRNIAGRKSKMARGRQKQLDRLDKMEALEQKELAPRFQFAALPVTNAEYLSVERLSVGYDSAILSGLHLSMKGGEKIVITGFNGSGKSTLLKTLTGRLPVLGGTFHFSDRAVIGYFEQDLVWQEKAGTPTQIFSDQFPHLTAKDVRTQLARCGISNRHALQAVGTLSGGEQAKVKLGLLTLQACNFLILDEPTNHLDAQAKEALKTALVNFPGSVLLVSHEEAFYHGWVQRVLRIADMAER